MCEQSSEHQWRRIATEVQPKWTGDLEDDCSVVWAGFLLRAEWMQNDIWWWAVYDHETGGQLDCSNNHDGKVSSGSAARAAAERAAKELLGIVEQEDT